MLLSQLLLGLRLERVEPDTPSPFTGVPGAAVFCSLSSSLCEPVAALTPLAGLGGLSRALALLH